MPSSEKVFRDPLYNYVVIDRQRDPMVLGLLDAPEVQRLRRIHQLGVSHFTYPGAEHTRFSHTMGVLHLMQQALDNLGNDSQVNQGREPLLAAALLHDVGHAPFSHTFERCLNIDHEFWSCQIIRDPQSQVNQILTGISPALPETVAGLVEKSNNSSPRWQKNLLSSQLDVDRLDYLRRDSLFTGAGYGHFDWSRILRTMRLEGPLDRSRDVVWEPKAALAIEEYIFSRYYMYWNVYLHRTTRGFECTLAAIWSRARKLHADGKQIDLVDPIRDFWAAEAAGGASVRQFLALEEAVVFYQMQRWADSTNADAVLSDLSRRILHRRTWACIEEPDNRDVLASRREEWEEELRKLVASSQFEADSYCLKDELKAKYSEPYYPEKEGDEQEVGNSIRLFQGEDLSPIEISESRERLKPITDRARANRYRYYVPKELGAQAHELWAKFSQSAAG